MQAKMPDGSIELLEGLSREQVHDNLARFFDAGATEVTVWPERMPEVAVSGRLDALLNGDAIAQEQHAAKQPGQDRGMNRHQRRRHAAMMKQQRR